MESLNEIIAEYRNDADAMDKGELYTPTTEYVRRLLDRIKAACEREHVGNASAMREACVNIAGYAQTAKCHTEDGHILGYLDQIEKWAKAALSSPPRNCDVGTAEEQAERMDAYCASYGERIGGGWRCDNCPLCSIDRCDLVWAQMPYEAEEGAGK